MAVSLKDASTALQTRGKLIVIYGKGGVGKTELAAKAAKKEGGILIQTGEDGLSPLGIEVPHINVGVGSKSDIDSMSQNWDDYCDILKQIIVEKHDYKILCTDPISKLMNSFDAYLVKKYYGGDFDRANSYSNKFKYYLPEFGRILQAYEIILAKNIDILVTCHGVITDFRDPSAENYKKYDLLLPGSEKVNLASELYNHADAVLFGTFETEVKDGKVIGSGKRILLSSNNPAYANKDRIGFPDKMLLDWDVIKSFLTKKKA